MLIYFFPRNTVLGSVEVCKANSSAHTEAYDDRQEKNKKIETKENMVRSKTVETYEPLYRLNT